MPVPPKRRPVSAKRRRRSHLALKKSNLAKCPKCGQAVKSHETCLFCGFYKGREVIAIKPKKAKKTK
ncbi:50S ribosomal protein L32 [Candidatus Falkowbacteria bacterium RIFOXYB2_FULL_47_14]|uniref:Large ribosomal subunit protein bL32 n=1 Tax=Candidatus Falkowbacteria bacterium RIFOXYA2_FULL_47_19 TaxID=1797994 RepID=A0A1F5SN76_9BACT|nr:MAG: 50S ribosomal protein L32 [Candidatus Falkowbacteria bacterium RIFOXYA2_FULL_47_19]OGF36205.1 MAG: 50S ribosomal protein L32 [Candidatus Falkowbacteria bacterium RIFOXYC2_FULL_46_15]OGF42888.1 MAG: 50S ribosomal protein L32 [Candidatus Falkowbacteria bacterium RIFOXYB2_FULL_47_14]